MTFIAAKGRVRFWNQSYKRISREQAVAARTAFGLRGENGSERELLLGLLKIQIPATCGEGCVKQMTRDYEAARVLGASRMADKFDCQRLQFARNVKIASIATPPQGTRIGSRDTPQGKLGEKSFYFGGRGIDFLPIALPPARRRPSFSIPS